MRTKNAVTVVLRPGELVADRHSAGVPGLRRAFRAPRAAVVDGVIGSHEGSVNAANRPGEGTTSHVYLPPLQETPAHGARGRGRHVLFLDDDAELVFAMMRTLPRHGYRVSGYTDPSAALDAVRAAPQAYDVFVSDYRMPQLSGLDVARELSRIRPDLPVIIVSGYIDEELQRKALELGVRLLLNKQHDLDEFLAAIDRLTGSAGSRPRPATN